MVKSAGKQERAIEPNEASGPSKFADEKTQKAIFNLLNLKAPKAQRLVHLPTLAEKASSENTYGMACAKPLPKSDHSAFSHPDKESTASMNTLSKKMTGVEKTEALPKPKRAKVAKGSYKDAIARAKEVGVLLPENYRKRYNPDEIIQLVNVVDTYYKKQYSSKRKRPGF